MQGYILIDKPEGWTSFDVVAKVRGQLRGVLRAQTGERRKLKVGHTGTLDPAATGLMVILVGSYTKRAAELTKCDKRYVVELTLGKTSDTGDKEGRITAVSEYRPDQKTVIATVEEFVGEISQTPPAFSAIKINGQRAYKLARAGKEVVIEPRQVQVYEITSISYSYPKLFFTTRVSSGTYIRSLARDIGEQLGVGAYMSNLRRESVGEFELTDAVGVDADFQAHLKVIDSVK